MPPAGSDGKALSFPNFCAAKKGEAFLPEYDALLAATGLGDVKDVAARVGIDVTDVNFWRKSLSVVEKMIDEMEKLA